MSKKHLKLIQKYKVPQPLYHSKPASIGFICLEVKQQQQQQNTSVILNFKPLTHPLHRHPTPPQHIHTFSASVNLIGTIFKICLAFTNTACHPHCYFFGPYGPDYCREPLKWPGSHPWPNSGYSAWIRQPERCCTKGQVRRHHSSSSQYQLWLLPISQNKTLQVPYNNLYGPKWSCTIHYPLHPCLVSGLFSYSPGSFLSVTAFTTTHWTCQISYQPQGLLIGIPKVDTLTFFGPFSHKSLQWTLPFFPNTFSLYPFHPSFCNIF